MEILLPLPLMCDERDRETWAKDKTDPLTCEHASEIAPLQNSDDNLLWESVKKRCVNRVN